jgi:alpha-L-fucosidase
VTTQKGETIFVHILEPEDELLFLPLEGVEVGMARWFADGDMVPFTRVPGGILLQTGSLPHATDHVVEIQLQ